MKDQEVVRICTCDNCQGRGSIDIQEGETWRDHAHQLNEAPLSEIKKFIQEGSIDCPECSGHGDYERVENYAVPEYDVINR